MSRTNFLVRPLPAAAMLVMAACATPPPAANIAEQSSEQTAASASFSETKALADRTDPLARARIWADVYNQDQTLLEPAIEFAIALRAIGSNKEAIDVAARSTMLHIDSYDLMMVYGRALGSERELPRAAQIYSQAIEIDPQRADAYAALGLVYDKGERHDLAQQAYARAIELDPMRTRTLSNYGLSLALSGHLDQAEEILRKAISIPGADQRVEQNLALILGLQGKFDDMQTVSASAPATIMRENADALRQMLGVESPGPVGTAPVTPSSETIAAMSAPVIAVEETVITTVPVSPETLPEPAPPIVETAEQERPRLRGSLSE